MRINTTQYSLSKNLDMLAKMVQRFYLDYDIDRNPKKYDVILTEAGREEFIQWLSIEFNVSARYLELRDYDSKDYSSVVFCGFEFIEDEFFTQFLLKV